MMASALTNWVLRSRPFLLYGPTVVLLAAWVAHDRAHLAQVGLIVRAAMLAGMGNARAFGHAVEAARWQAGHVANPER